jgi:hypothetical protein
MPTVASVTYQYGGCVGHVFDVTLDPPPNAATSGASISSAFDSRSTSTDDSLPGASLRSCSASSPGYRICVPGERRLTSHSPMPP